MQVTDEFTYILIKAAAIMMLTTVVTLIISLVGSEDYYGQVRAE
jgi:hypothetical protein